MMMTIKIAKAYGQYFRKASIRRKLRICLIITLFCSTQWTFWRHMSAVCQREDFSKATFYNMIKNSSLLDLRLRETNISTFFKPSEPKTIVKVEENLDNPAKNNNSLGLKVIETDSKTIFESPEPKTIIKVKELLDRPVINSYAVDFNVTLSHKCMKVKPEVIIVIPTARENFQRRTNVRKGTQGQYTRAKSNPKSNDFALMIFFVGKPSPNEKVNITEKFNEEVSMFNDIVVGDFEDVYHNILTKHVTMLKWVLRFCPRTEFVMRTDDDIHANNISKMVQEMRKYKVKFENFILGRAGGHSPLTRDPSNVRRYVSRQDYAPDMTPVYVWGAAIGYPLSTVKLLLAAAQRIRKVWLDDVYITGICREALDIPRCDCEAFHFGT